MKIKNYLPKLLRVRLRSVNCFCIFLKSSPLREYSSPHPHLMILFGDACDIESLFFRLHSPHCTMRVALRLLSRSRSYFGSFTVSLLCCKDFVMGFQKNIILVVLCKCALFSTILTYKHGLFNTENTKGWVSAVTSTL